ncbi:AbrB/MazE/SpoVT family DNA-binding domain-containing protein [archaeon]|nr:AbrB/MazE/SpoVT family DNA-binding domain-containing protein [archaeon]
MKVISKTKKIGGSIMVRIPKDLAEAEGITENQTVEIEIRKPKKDFFGALKGIGSFTKEDELNTHE